MRILAAILSIGLASEAWAEPLSEVNVLIDRKVTIFDWGMFNLERQLGIADIDVSVGYNWDENQVRITTFNLAQAGNSNAMEQTKSGCEEVFAKIDDFLWIRDGNDSVEKLCRFCSFFA